MNRIREYRAAFFIFGVGVLSAVAIVLISGLFEEFRVGQFFAIVALFVGMVSFAIAANRNRRFIAK